MPQEELEKDEVKQRAVAGFKWVALGKGVATAYSFVITLLMVRLLSPADYGKQAMWEAPIELAVMLGVFCLDQSLIRHKVRDPRVLSELFGLLILASSSSAVILYLMAPAIAIYFGVEGLAEIIRVLTIIVLVAPLRVIPNALLDSQMRFKIKALIEISAIITASTSGLLLAYLGCGVWALVGVMLIDAFMKIGLMALYNPWIIRPSFKVVHAKPVVRYASRLMIGATALLVGSKATSIIAGPILGAEEIGLYAVAVTFALLPMVKLMPIINQVLFPTFANLRQESDVKGYYLSILRICTILVFPLAIGMAVTATQLVSVVFGSKWVSMGVLLAWLAALTPLRLVSQLSATVLNASGSASRVSKMTVFISFANVICVYPMTAWWGLYGLVALSYLLRIVEYIWTVRMLESELRISCRDQLRQIKMAAVCSCLMFAAVMLGHELASGSLSDKTLLFFEVVLGGGVYVVSMMVLYGRQVKSMVTAFLGRP